MLQSLRSIRWGARRVERTYDASKNDRSAGFVPMEPIHARAWLSL